MMAPPVCGVFSSVWFSSPPTAEVVQVVVERFNKAARTGMPSSCNFSEFFRRFSCRSLSYSGTSTCSSLPHPSSEANDSELSESRDPENPEVESSGGKGESATFAGVSIAAVSTVIKAWETIFNPCHRHFGFQQVRSSAAKQSA